MAPVTMATAEEEGDDDSGDASAADAVDAATSRRTSISSTSRSWSTTTMKPPELGYEMALEINDYPEIDGLGERAYDSRPIGGVNVLQGRYELSVDVSAERSDADFDMAAGLAERAVDRLP